DRARSARSWLPGARAVRRALGPLRSRLPGRMAEGARLRSGADNGGDGVPGVGSHRRGPRVQSATQADQVTRRTDQMAVVERELSLALHHIGAVRFGEFTLKDGRRSPFYLDLRVLVSHPDVLARVGRAMLQRAEDLRYDRLAGLPYAG